MSMIKFNDACHLAGKKFERFSEVDESLLDDKWLAKALKAKFVSRVEVAVVEKKEEKTEDTGGASGTQQTEEKTGVPDDVAKAMQDALQ